MTLFYSMNMALEFWKNQQKIVESVEKYLSSFDGIDRVVYLPLSQKTLNDELERERNSIDRSNKHRTRWYGRLFGKQSLRYLFVYNTRIPNDPYNESPIPECTYFITGAEVYPPFPDVEQNELVVAGLSEVLSRIEDSATIAPLVSEIQTVYCEPQMQAQTEHAFPVAQL